MLNVFDPDSKGQDDEKFAHHCGVGFSSRCSPREGCLNDQYLRCSERLQPLTMSPLQTIHENDRVNLLESSEAESILRSQPRTVSQSRLTIDTQTFAMFIWCLIQIASVRAGGR